MSKTEIINSKRQFDLKSKTFRDVYDYVKIYPDFIKVIKYNRPLVVSTVNLPDSGVGIENDEPDQKNTDDTLKKSINRTKTKISDYILCNDFDMFATFTFDPKIVGEKSRYNFLYCANLLSEWLRVEQQNHQRKFGSKFRYLIVPEQHKDGAWHFHAVIGGYKSPTLTFTDLSNKWLTYAERSKYSLKTRKFFTRYNLGRNELQPIRSRERLASYIKKYITKSLLELPGKKRYWSSRNLLKPTIMYNLFKCEKIPKIAEVFSNDYFTIYKLDYSIYPDLKILPSLFPLNRSKTIPPDNPDYSKLVQSRLFS